MWRSFFFILIEKISDMEQSEESRKIHAQKM